MTKTIKSFQIQMARNTSINKYSATTLLISTLCRIMNKIFVYSIPKLLGASTLNGIMLELGLLKIMGVFPISSPCGGA